jgi:hypothetical protein
MLGVRGCMCGGVVGDGYMEGWTGVVGERGGEVGVRVGVYFGGGGGGGRFGTQADCATGGQRRGDWQLRHPLPHFG